MKADLQFMKDRYNDAENGDFDKFETGIKRAVANCTGNIISNYKSSGKAFSDYVDKNLKEGYLTIDEGSDLDTIAIELYTKFGNKSDWQTLVGKEIKKYDKASRDKIMKSINKLIV